MREPPRPALTQALLHWAEMTGPGTAGMSEPQRRLTLLCQLHRFRAPFADNDKYKHLIAALEAWATK